jgi:hypothetical protein
MSKATKKPTPNKLSKTGRKAGIQLTETQLDQASGGLNFVKAPLKLKI